MVAVYTVKAIHRAKEVCWENGRGSVDEKSPFKIAAFLLSQAGKIVCSCFWYLEKLA